MRLVGTRVFPVLESACKEDIRSNPVPEGNNRPGLQPLADADLLGPIFPRHWQTRTGEALPNASRTDIFPGAKNETLLPLFCASNEAVPL